MNKDNCDLLDLPFTVNSGQLALAWSKHLPHGLFFDHFIKKMKESGQIHRILYKLNPKPQSDCGKNRKFVSFGLDNTISAFGMDGLGFIVALVAIVTEMICRYRFWKAAHPQPCKSCILESS